MYSTSQILLLTLSLFERYTGSAALQTLVLLLPVSVLSHFELHLGI